MEKSVIVALIVGVLTVVLLCAGLFCVGRSINISKNLTA